MYYNVITYKVRLHYNIYFQLSSIRNTRYYSAILREMLESSEPQKKQSQILTPILALLLLACIGGAGYLGYLHYQLTLTYEDLSESYQNNQRLLEFTDNRLAEREQELLQTTEDLNVANTQIAELERDLYREKNMNQEFEKQIRDLAGTVGTLNRIAELDKELLQKYSRVFFLSENYRPARMTEIPSRFVLEGRASQFFLTDAFPFLEDMLVDAKRKGIELRVVSTFRSFDEQSDLKGQFTQLYGSGANAFSADQGYSEHQLGTAVDLTTPEIGGTYPALKDTEAYEWLRENAHRYGFILSYPEGNQFYIFEPWHWRFVGRDLAQDLHRRGMNFYDMDQREISTYLISIFD